MMAKVINLNQETIVYVENICENFRGFYFFKYLCRRYTSIKEWERII